MQIGASQAKFYDFGRFQGYLKYGRPFLYSKITHFMAEHIILLHKLGTPYLKYPWNQIHKIWLEMPQSTF